MKALLRFRYERVGEGRRKWGKKMSKKITCNVFVTEFMNEHLHYRHKRYCLSPQITPFNEANLDIRDRS